MIQTNAAMTTTVVTTLLKTPAQRARPLHDAHGVQWRRHECLGVFDVLLLLDAVDDAVDDPMDDELQHESHDDRADDDRDDLEGDSPHPPFRSTPIDAQKCAQLLKSMILRAYRGPSERSGESNIRDL